MKLDNLWHFNKASVELPQKRQIKHMKYLPSHDLITQSVLIQQTRFYFKLSSYSKVFVLYNNESTHSIRGVNTWLWLWEILESNRSRTLTSLYFFLSESRLSFCFQLWIYFSFCRFETKLNLTSLFCLESWTCSRPDWLILSVDLTCLTLAWFHFTLSLCAFGPKN